MRQKRGVLSAENLVDRMLFSRDRKLIWFKLLKACEEQNSAFTHYNFTHYNRLGCLNISLIYMPDFRDCLNILLIRT